MKPTASFKLSRAAKCVLATISNKAQRASVRKLFIESEVEYETNKRKSAKSREKSDD